MRRRRRRRRKEPEGTSPVSVNDLVPSACSSVQPPLVAQPE